MTKAVLLMSRHIHGCAAPNLRFVPMVGVVSEWDEIDNNGSLPMPPE